MTTEKKPKEKIKVVLDTNIYISIFINLEGELSTLWEHALKGTYILLISPAIAAETAGILRHKFQWPPEAVTARTKRFVRIAEIVTPKNVPAVITADPADNQILACALSGKADLIVSGDRHHLLPLKNTRESPSFPLLIFSGCWEGYKVKFTLKPRISLRVFLVIPLSL